MTHTHIALPVSVFLITTVLSLYFGLTRGYIAGVSAFALFVAGWFGFTLVEYCVHRYLYHMPAKTERRAKIQYTMHGVHHEYPKDKSRLAMPPIISVFVVSVLFFVFRFVFGSAAFGVLAGFVFGYALYLFVHYAIHAYAPPKNFLKVWWLHHSQHHYRQDEIAFGVSTTIWDHIIGTMPKTTKPSAN